MATVVLPGSSGSCQGKGHCDLSSGAGAEGVGGAHRKVDLALPVASADALPPQSCPSCEPLPSLWSCWPFILRVCTPAISWQGPSLVT